MTEWAIRAATPADVPVIFELIQALAAYENLSPAVTGQPEWLRDHLFGDRPCIEALLAVWSEEVVGFALFFPNYSTFLTQPGLYLEDLFVKPEYRGRGLGRALLQRLAQVAVARGAGRLEWNVLDWNAPAIAFYEKVGANVLPDWRTCRLTGANLQALAAGSAEPVLPES